MWNFSYDGDGTRVARLYTPYDANVNAQTPIFTYFLGGAYEVTGSLEVVLQRKKPEREYKQFWTEKAKRI